jgi:hypothetical protein
MIVSEAETISELLRASALTLNLSAGPGRAVETSIRA